jgi:hypothetical protein
LKKGKTDPPSRGLQLAGRSAGHVILGAGFDLRILESAKIKYVKEPSRQAVMTKRLP